MRTPAVALTAAVTFALVATAEAQAPGTPTLELARLQKGVKSRRVSSYDTTGATTTASRACCRVAGARFSTSRVQASSTISG
jgi:hypothetical protein